MWVMTLRISSDQRQQLFNWAEQAAPNECCGLLFGENGLVAEMELVANVAADPARHFELDPKALITAEKAARAGGKPILGYFHSHPSGDCSPSMTDAAQAAPDGRIWVIVGGGEMAVWQAVENGSIHARFRAVL
jgi:desampylase